MSGFAGLRPVKRQKHEVSVSKKPSQNLRVVCAGLAVGQVVCIANGRGFALFDPLKEK